MTLECDNRKGRLVITCSDPRCEHVDGAFVIREAGGALFLLCQQKVLSEDMGLTPDMAKKISLALFRASLTTLMGAAVARSTPIMHVEVRIHSHCAAATKLGLAPAGQREAAIEMASIAQAIFVEAEVVVVHDDHCERGKERVLKRVEMARAA